MPKYERTLHDHISKNKGRIKVHEVVTIMQQLCRSLQILHRVGYNHNDLKPNNIMIDNDLNINIIDLGYTSKFMDSHNVHIKR